jgi:ATP-binding cassette subfamily B protein RaxB
LLQTEAAECGLACLAMVASAHGLLTDLAALRQRFSLSLKGVTMADLVRMADGLQLQSRALRAELDELEQLQTPCILHWDLNHFVVLVSVRRGMVTIHDPAHGQRRLTLAQVSPRWRRPTAATYARAGPVSEVARCCCWRWRSRPSCC